MGEFIFSSNWSSEFVKNLLELSDPGEIVSAAKLVKKHDKSLSQNGDFSCPGDIRIWKRVVNGPDVKIHVEKLVQTHELMLKKVNISKNGYIVGFFDRNAFIHSFFKEDKHVINADEPQNYSEREVKNLSKSDKSELTSIRCMQACKFAERLLNCPLVASRNKGCRIQFSINDVSTDCIKVGPVINKGDKKKSSETFLEKYLKFYHVFDDASKQRPNLSETKRISSVHSVICAELQFQLLGHNLNQPAILDEKCEKTATFVLYNHARIVQLLHAGGQIDQKLVKLELLTEDEEWELVYVYLSQYLDLLNSILLPSDIKTGRLCQFLLGLTSTFSRYYNRVHVLKEAQHLLPTQHTRLYLIHRVKLVLEHGLYLLDISGLGQM